MKTTRATIADYLSLERNVSIASAAVFLLGFGEELWKKFLPKYLEVLGASAPVIGLFGTAENFFDAIYQYPGGWIADRFGRRRAFLIFIVAGGNRLSHLPDKSGLAISFSGTRFRDGLAEHGFTRDLCHHRRFAASGSPGDGFYSSVDSETRADCDCAANWWSTDRKTWSR